MSQAKLNVVTALAELYRRELSEASVKLYVAALGELNDQQTERAAATAARKHKFMPTPSELIEIAKTGGVSYEAQALLAFEELDGALDANKPSMMGPITAAVVRSIGGFEPLRQIPLSELNTWKRKDFIAAHITLCKENPERLKALAGPHSGIALAFKKIQTREDAELIEQENRKKIELLRRAIP